jgi:pimeloyl-ACP methyl ester carboxylesterase
MKKIKATYLAMPAFWPNGRRAICTGLCAFGLFALGGCAGNDDSTTSAAADGATVSSADKCAALKGTSLRDNTATITDVKLQAASTSQPEYCVVEAKMNDSELVFRANLPTSAWNGKMVYLGGGGFDGMINNLQFSDSVSTERYATVSTNGGYTYPSNRDATYFEASFAYDPLKLADFTYASEHHSLPAAKDVLAKFYGSGPSRSYYEGCSMGGHDAMMESQRYPDDFDGIVARAPAGNIMGLFVQFNRIAKLAQAPGLNFNAAKQQLLANEVLRQCDALDGVSDGIISNPSACNIETAPLRCPGGGDNGNSCLSDAQIALAKAVTTPVSTTDHAWSHPGYNWGQENGPAGWAEYVWAVPSAPFNGRSLQGTFSQGFIRSFITRDPNYDPMGWDANAWLPEMGIIGAMYSANNPDLSRLAARGSKLILWNGTNDTSVSSRDTARYYDNVVQTMGQAAADKTVEFFQAPGVGHCSGGVGPDKVDLLKAVSTWVEQGVAPSRQSLVHAKVDTAGKATITRPVCKYPAFPRYKGSGDINTAASFDCVSQ